MFSPGILEKYHARLVNVRKNQMLFQEGDIARDYYQVEKGIVKMCSASEDGREFIHGLFFAGESFGEPALISNFPYPGSAIAIEPGSVWKLPGDHFLRMLKENFDLHIRMDQVLCNRLKYKSMVLSELSTHDPEHRITSLLTHYKQKQLKPGDHRTRIVIPFTRQQIADMSGLRVETVIRTIRRMEKQERLVLADHKIKF